MPRVSVIIPSYNHARYIRQCIDSALGQTYPDVEVVVVDDGSTDGTYEILQTYGDAIILLRQENRGTQAARNAAIGASIGEFIALLDSDDAWRPEKLERQIPLFGNPSIGLVYSFAQIIDADGQLIQAGEPLGRMLSNDRPAFQQLFIRNAIPTLTAVFRRQCLDSRGGFSESYVGIADRAMWLCIASVWDLACVPEPLAFYRKHEYNTTRSLHTTRQAYAELVSLHEEIVKGPLEALLNPQIIAEARAEAEFLGAECASLAHDASACAKHLARACQFTPEVLSNPETLQRRVLSLALRDRTVLGLEEAEQFARQLFSALAHHSLVLRGVRRATLAEINLADAFARHACADRKREVPAPLLRAISGHPQYLQNLGVWSLLGTAIVGQRVMDSLRPLARRLLCPASPSSSPPTTAAPTSRRP